VRPVRQIGESNRLAHMENTALSRLHSNVEPASLDVKLMDADNDVDDGCGEVIVVSGGVVSITCAEKSTPVTFAPDIVTVRDVGLKV